MKVYIAGAITADPNYKIKFDRAERELTGRGYEAVNPAKNTPKKGNKWTYRDYINAGLKQLMTCDAIYLLDGWSASKGAGLEAHYAATAGIEVMYQRPEER